MFQQVLNRFAVTLTILLGATTAVSPAWAQTHVTSHIGHHPVGHLGHHGGFHGFPGYGYGYGATAPGSYAHGLADLVRAHGEHNRQSAEAAISLQQAQQLEIENRKRRIQAHHELRRLYRADRVAEQAKRRDRMVQFFQNRTRPKPVRLGGDQLDPDSGAIAWPAVLTKDTFARERQGLEVLFQKRADQEGELSSDEQLKIQQTANAMLEGLKTHIRKIRSSDYVVAMRFVEALSNETRLTAKLPNTQLANLRRTHTSLTSQTRP